MTEKVKLPKDVCDALDYFQRNYKNCHSELIYLIVKQVPNKFDDNLLILMDQNADTIMRALVLGYKPKETPEEKIYKRYMNGFSATHCREVFRAGIREALQIHGIHYDWLEGDAE